MDSKLSFTKDMTSYIYNLRVTHTHFDISNVGLRAHNNSYNTYGWESFAYSKTPMC